MFKVERKKADGGARDKSAPKRLDPSKYLVSGSPGFFNNITPMGKGTLGGKVVTKNSPETSDTSEFESKYS